MKQPVVDVSSVCLFYTVASPYVRKFKTDSPSNYLSLYSRFSIHHKLHFSKLIARIRKEWNGFPFECIGFLFCFTLYFLYLSSIYKPSCSIFLLNEWIDTVMDFYRTDYLRIFYVHEISKPIIHILAIPL